MSQNCEAFANLRDNRENVGRNEKTEGIRHIGLFFVKETGASAVNNTHTTN
jgi:hypothetical protein